MLNMRKHLGTMDAFQALGLLSILYTTHDVANEHFRLTLLEASPQWQWALHSNDLILQSVPSHHFPAQVSVSGIEASHVNIKVLAHTNNIPKRRYAHLILPQQPR